MILSSFGSFDISSDEGRMLLASIVILSSNEEIFSGKYGSKRSPDQIIDLIRDLANKIFFEEEYFRQEKINKREELIENIIGI